MYVWLPLFQCLVLELFGDVFETKNTRNTLQELNLCLYQLAYGKTGLLYNISHKVKEPTNNIEDLLYMCL